MSGPPPPVGSQQQLMSGPHPHGSQRLVNGPPPPMHLHMGYGHQQAPPPGYPPFGFGHQHVPPPAGYHLLHAFGPPPPPMCPQGYGFQAPPLSGYPFGTIYPHYSAYPLGQPYVAPPTIISQSSSALSVVLGGEDVSEGGRGRPTSFDAHYTWEPDQSRDYPSRGTFTANESAAMAQSQSESVLQAEYNAALSQAELQHYQEVGAQVALRVADTQ